MNDDALAAVLAAAQLLLARRTSAPAPERTARWPLAARVRVDGAQHARLLARAASRWTVAGRLRG